MNEVWKKPPVTLETYQAMVGKEVGVSSWHLIDQSRINVYADVIEDHQFIHVDPERAKKETAFGNTVAHGFLTMSLMSIMSYEVMPVIEGTTMGVNYGFDKLRFLSPVRAGSRVRGRFVLARAMVSAGRMRWGSPAAAPRSWSTISAARATAPVARSRRRKPWSRRSAKPAAPRWPTAPTCRTSPKSRRWWSAPPGSGAASTC